MLSTTNRNVCVLLYIHFDILLRTKCRVAFIFFCTGYQFGLLKTAKPPLTANPNSDTYYALPLHTGVPVAVSYIGINDTSLQWPEPTYIGTEILYTSVRK